MYWTTSKRYPLKSSTRLYYTPLLTAGSINPIYRDGTSKKITTRRPSIFLSVWKSPSKQKKEEHLLKPPLGNIPTVPVLAVNIREEKQPRQPTLRRAALASEGKTMQAIRVIRRLMTKHVCFMDLGTPWRNSNYSRNALRSTPCSVHIKKKNPAPAAKISVVSHSSLTMKRRRSTTWHPMLNPPQGKRRKQSA